MTKVRLDDDERRIVLMGLALLSLDHPDWQDVCYRVAMQFGSDAGELYVTLRRFREGVVLREFREPPQNAREESPVDALARRALEELPPVQASAPNPDTPD